MKIPKKLIKGNKEYIFIKAYPENKYALYEDNLGLKECFKFDELGLIKQIVPPTRDVNPEVKI